MSILIANSSPNLNGTAMFNDCVKNAIDAAILMPNMLIEL
jgi:hypothetical protein